MKRQVKAGLVLLLALAIVCLLTACGGGFTGNPAIFN